MPTFYKISYRSVHGIHDVGPRYYSYDDSSLNQLYQKRGVNPIN
jgi:hypothetical protein